MKFLVVCTLIWVSVQGQYVYEAAAQTVEVQRFDETAAGSFDQVLGAFDADIGESGFGNAKLQRNNCKSQCFCGTSIDNRIVGGTQVRQNKYPWTAQLVKGRHYPRLFCGGSLISDRYVLTAAHCVHGNRDEITIRLLQLDRLSRDPSITRKVVRTIVHPQYNPNTIVNDVALLKLKSPVTFNDEIRPVCLPDANQTYEGRNAIVAGWGLLKEGGQLSNYLQEATVPIISNQECRLTRYKNIIQDVMLCAGLVKSGGKDACRGDGGGPLMVNEGRFSLVGVVSFGYGCGQANAPGVYTRVTKFLSWIETNTKDGCYCSA